MFEFTSHRRLRASICVRSCLAIVLMSLIGDPAVAHADFIAPVSLLTSSRILDSLEGGQLTPGGLDAWVNFTCGCDSDQSRSETPRMEPMAEKTGSRSDLAFDLGSLFFSFGALIASFDGLTSSGCSSLDSSSSLSSQVLLSAALLSPHEDFPDPILIRYLRGSTETVIRQLPNYCLFRPPKSQNPLQNDCILVFAGF